jgi:hypothetical protein
VQGRISGVLKSGLKVEKREGMKIRGLKVGIRIL